MGAYAGVSIPKGNLGMIVDVTNLKSYSGSGTVWTDPVGPRDFTSNGTQTPLETVLGVQSFAFNGSGNWRSDTNTGGVDMGGDCTLLMWLYCENIGERDTIFEKAGSTSYQQEIAVTWETSNAFSYYSRRSPNYDFAGTNALTINAWELMGIKMSTGKTTAARTGFYSKNGAPWTSNYTSRSNVAVEAAGQIRIGTGYAGAVENGNVALVAQYNKMLTNEEVKQFYDATRGRFGL